ncbi:MAG: RimK family alpha-L-glutamate ligase [Thermoproteota archaeon]|jgi:alpha-L-glutamate ligases, RimK family
MQELHVAVLDYNSTPSYTSLSLLRELKRRGHHAYYLTIDKFACDIKEGKVEVNYQGKSIDKIDLFFLRTIGTSINFEKMEYRINILRCIESLKKPVINPVEGYLKARNKFTCLSLLANKGIKVPETFVTENEFLAYEFVKKMGKCVVKPIIGSRGVGSFLIDDADVGFRRIQELKEKGYSIYLQRYINKPNRDIRVIVVGDEVLGGMARESNYWKTNVYQGAEAKPIILPKEVENLALKVTKELGLMYSGVDIAEENGDYYVLEVNSSPLWHGFLSSTGINPAIKLIDLAERLVKK